MRFQLALETNLLLRNGETQERVWFFSPLLLFQTYVLQLEISNI